jgi:hypothetical protein
MWAKRERGATVVHWVVRGATTNPAACLEVPPQDRAWLYQDGAVVRLLLPGSYCAECLDVCVALGWKD